jgi:hypothetical protein
VQKLDRDYEDKRFVLTQDPVIPSGSYASYLTSAWLNVLPAKPYSVDPAKFFWAQHRHGAASCAPLLRWLNPITRNAKLAWNPEGKLIATVSQTERLQLWEAESGKLLPELGDPNLKLSDQEGDVRFSSDGERIILKRSNDLWSVISMEERKLIFESESEKRLHGEPISPNGKQAVSLPRQCITVLTTTRS